MFGTLSCHAKIIHVQMLQRLAKEVQKKVFEKGFILLEIDTIGFLLGEYEIHHLPKNSNPRIC